MARSQVATGYSGLVNATPVTNNPVSMACWYNPTAFTSFDTPMAIGRKASLTNYVQMYALTNTNNELTVTEWGTGTAIGAIMTTGSWQHCCVANNTNLHNVFRNGVKTSTTTAGTSTGFNQITLGAQVTDSNGTIFSINGLLEKCAIWNVQLSDSDVEALSRGAHPFTIKRSALRFYVPLIGDRSPEIDIIGGLSLTTSNSSKAESKPGTVRGGWR